ncbi:MAG: NADH-quinone oxidoreductase subunit NuoG [Gammaproteobacteria bacterium]|nr:NADH-quinone oxidoreductase subunit NuoG [Gammaproteobacteria bacterium]
MAEETINIEINGQPFKARKGQMVIEVTDDAGIRIPRFCYHKKLSVAANCRMCLVEVEKAPKPLPACATPVMDGMKVHTRSPLALKAQKTVMEFLLINHPLDCPICDQGGECELQDVAMGYGRDVSRFVERKRVVKDKDLGPLIATDMTRCIHCTRCVRFGEEVGGMPELGATGRGEHMEIGTFIEQQVTSEMSGNVIDLCPVGALTSKPFRFRARAWEMQQRPGVAPHDPVGSNIDLHIGRNRVLRVVPRENEAINEVWISDRDRFSYEGLYTDDRLLSPKIKRDGRWLEVDWQSALEFVAEGLERAGKPGALVSPGATVEELFLMQRLVRGLGSNDIDHRLRAADVSDQEHAPAYPALGLPIADLERLDAALLVGSNSRKEHPIVNHRLRKASLRGAAVSLINPVDYEFNFRIAERIIARPSRLGDELLGVAATLDESGQGAGLDALTSGVAVEARHRSIAKSLVDGERAAILLGPSAINHPAASFLRGVASALATATGASLGFLCEGANAAGAWIAGAVPHRHAGGKAVAQPGASAAQMASEPRKACLLLGVEPERDCGNPAAAVAALGATEFTVALSAYSTSALEGFADVLLPVAAFAETSGTYINMEGVWQSFEGGAPPPGEARPAWKVLRVLGNLLDLEGFEQVSSTEVLDAVRAVAGDSRMPDQRTWPAPASRPAVTDGVERIGDVPGYAVDPLVRRARSLQRTRDAALADAAVNPALAATLGLNDGDRVSLRQNGFETIAVVGIDPSVPDRCVRVPAGIPVSETLGPSFGPLEIAKA